jgi:DNA-binding GntR family transcriptional regulator
MEALPRHTTVFESVYEALRESICEGHLLPGERINQDETADSLGVSRQPVGQALILLKSQGFVHEAGRRGVVVAPLSVDKVRAIYELRGALDGLAANLASARAQSTLLRRGQEIVEQGKRLVADGNVRDLVKADMAFHELVYEMSGNPLIRPALAVHWHHLRRVMSGVIEQGDYREVLWREHDAILEAIRAGDRTRAAELSQRHVDAASRSLCHKLTTDAGQ